MTQDLKDMCLIEKDTVKLLVAILDKMEMRRGISGTCLLPTETSEAKDALVQAFNQDLSGMVVVPLEPTDSDWAKLAKSHAALLREVEYLRDSQEKRSYWLRKAKKEAGYHDRVSFDEVWKDALSALKERKAMLSAAQKEKNDD